MKCHVYIVISLVQLIVSVDSLDPVVSYCRRAGHSSVYKNGTIFISGGIQTYRENGGETVTSGILDTMLQIDMNNSWDATKNLTFVRISKKMSGTISGYSRVLNINSGALFGGRSIQNRMWQFGGTTMGFNTSDPNYQKSPDTKHALWIYDDAAKLWSPIDTSQTQITMPSYGSSTEAPMLGLGFYLGGQLNNGTADTTQYDDGIVTKLGGMTVFDTDAGRISNLTVPGTANGSRRGAGLIYIGVYGSAGLLVMMGGHGDRLISLEQISVFDVSSYQPLNAMITGPYKNTWYSQTSTGDIPSPRRDFCLTYANAPDNSSVHIYLYGGRAAGVFYDEVYVLSLPSFQWTKVYTGNNPRWLHTCHRVGNRQMISLGGAGTNTNFTDCDASGGVGVFDMTSMTWGSSYNAFAKPYVVPDAIVAKIGGNATGAAVKVQPEKGWTMDNLAKVFAVRTRLTPNSTIGDVVTSTDDSGNGPTSTGNTIDSTGGNALSKEAIPGIVIGIGALVIFSMTLMWFMRWNKSRNHSERTNRERRLAWPRLFEAGSEEKHELPLQGQERQELGVEQVRVELSGTKPEISTYLKPPDYSQRRPQRHGGFVELP